MKNISDHVLDILQNSVRANATVIEVIGVEDNIRDIYSLNIIDNGCGMDAETLRKATNAFFTSRTKWKVGLGLALLKHSALASKGEFCIESEPGRGTEVKAIFQLSHLDCLPVADLGETIYLMLLGNPDVQLVYRHRTPSETFMIDSALLMDVLGEVSLNQADIKKAVND